MSESNTAQKKEYTDQEVMRIAAVCHEANRALCITQGDYSQLSWDMVPDNIADSALDGVRFHLENPDVTPEESHENWLKFKTEDGWTYGEYKDAENKKHPCMRPYSELPVEQQVKDRLFKAIVDALA